VRCTLVHIVSAAVVYIAGRSLAAEEDSSDSLAEVRLAEADTLGRRLDCRSNLRLDPDAPLRIWDARCNCNCVHYHATGMVRVADGKDGTRTRRRN
jgi:hypothetical protein